MQQVTFFRASIGPKSLFQVLIDIIKLGFDDHSVLVNYIDISGTRMVTIGSLGELMMSSM